MDLENGIRFNSLTNNVSLKPAFAVLTLLVLLCSTLRGRSVLFETDTVIKVIIFGYIGIIFLLVGHTVGVVLSAFEDLYVFAYIFLVLYKVCIIYTIAFHPEVSTNTRYRVCFHRYLHSQILILVESTAYYSVADREDAVVVKNCEYVV
jgi:hypothetical protein